jgi:hypothetical protein
LAGRHGDGGWWGGRGTGRGVGGSPAIAERPLALTLVGGRWTLSAAFVAATSGHGFGIGTLHLLPPIAFDR